MSEQSSVISTGLPGLDRVLQGLQPGDNIVWKVDSIENYHLFVKPLHPFAAHPEWKLVYFRFARHEPLVPEGIGAEIHTFTPEEGFEEFITETHRVIESHGPNTYYVFDCLSELALECYSDRMVGNFFMLTCPFVLEKRAVAYFAVLRNYHTNQAAFPISQTTQLMLDVYHHNGTIYVHPQKVQNRFSPTVFMLHAWKGNEFCPVTDSATVSEVVASSSFTGLETANVQMGVWNRVFLLAEDLLDAFQRGEAPAQRLEEVKDRLLCMILSRDERMRALARTYLTLADLVNVRKRMIGTGFIGGKSVGMLLAHAILRRQDPRWNDILETHDSFYIGSEVFYTYLVTNGCWWIRKRQQDPDTFLDHTRPAVECVLNGTFPPYIVRRFEAMLDYFGQSPIIVRSSSLLEDSFGNTFAGRYESIFCANQGPREQRLEQFTAAVRSIYASSMSEKALSYRAQRGLLDQDEQMALLVQRVSGIRYGQFFYPQLAGVGYSFNPYVWLPSIDPKAGMLRLVFGLGTRAVDRTDDDYTRILALNAPQLRPETGPAEIRRYTQRKADILNLETNQLEMSLVTDVLEKSDGLPRDLFLSPDEELVRLSREAELRYSSTSVLSFDHLFTRTNLIRDFREMLSTLETAYGQPIDIEFTVNFLAPNAYKIGLLQCRPFQIKGIGKIKALPPDLPREAVLLECHGAILGPSRSLPIDRIVYVVPSVYGNLPQTDRYSVARLIGQITRRPAETEKRLLLIGPGRWGTTTPSLGVPVSFAEISRAAVLCEMETMRADLTPEVSLGTHFFGNLVELDILYLALFPNRDGNFLNEPALLAAPNRLEELVPSAAPYADCIRVVDIPNLHLNANIFTQTAVCYREG